MLTQSSIHVDSVRRRATSYFPQEYDQPTKYRPALNVKKLIKSLQNSIPRKEVTTASFTPSRKRSASPLTAENTPKRQKSSPSRSEDSAMSEGSNGSVNGELDDEANDGDPDAEDSDDADWSPKDWESDWGKYPYAFVYPLISDRDDGFLQEENIHRLGEDHRPVPVFHHSFELHYTKDVLDEDEKEFVDDHTAQKRGWDREEDELINLLKQISVSAQEPTSVELGPLWLRRYRGRYVGLSEAPRFFSQEYGDSAQAESDKWFLVVPSIPWPNEVDFDADDYTESDVHGDILAACIVLGSMGRVALRTNLRLVVPPASAHDISKLELPFSLHVDITLSLVAPKIYEPIWSRNLTKRDLARQEDAQRRLLSLLFPPSARDMPSVPHHSDTGSTDIPFLYSILTAAPRLHSPIAEESMQPESLLPTLLPFQRRSVGWMLEREGKTVNSKGDIVPKSSVSDLDNSTLPLFWNKVEHEGDGVWYIHRLTGTLSSEIPGEECPPGGILAEEPGLGKTLECIALILLNSAPGRNPTISRWDSEAKITLKEIKTTLIVTPPSLASQWADELALHAPSLKVFVYDGWAKLGVPITQYDVEIEREKRRSAGKVKSAARGAKSGGTKGKKGKDKATYYDDDDYMDVDTPKSASVRMTNGDDGEEILDWCAYINTFDVCITTYNTLRQDLSVAYAPPVRPRREDVIYSNLERARSPLVMCEWHRVIMDEVQMVGGGKIEEMVSLIPRISSFAVSGTPARSQVSDLMHVLKFLRVDHLIGSTRLWNRLIKPGFADEFAAMFRRYAIRTMKSTVKDELTIPQQTRYLVGIDLGRVERHIYDQNLEGALLELGLDARGVAASTGWEVDAALLRSLLRKLRGICTHPQVGQLQKQGDKLIKPGALKTIGDVLDTMRDQNWRNLMDDRKSKIQIFIQRAQLQQHDEEDRTRYQHALETLILAEKEANKLIDEVKAVIGEHEEKGDVLKKEAAALRELRNPEVVEETNDKGKGKAPEREATPGSDADSEDHDLPKTPAGQEHGIKRRALQQRLRECNVTLHRVKFLQGDVYHVLGAPQEDEAYAAAEEIRRGLLKTTEEAATRAMATLMKDAAAKGLTQKSLLVQTPYCDKGGIRSSELMEEANEIIEGLLNQQSALLWEWRTCMHTLLTQSLKGDGSADGDEYSRSLDAQGEADVYLQAYTALMADRRATLVAERTLLAEHDGKEKKLRKTKAAKAATAAAMAAHGLQNPEILEDLELRPEHEVLFKDLTNARKALLEDFDGRAVKSIIVELNGIALRIRNDKDPEKVIIKEALSDLRKLIADQGTVMDKLEADLAQFRKAFNDRILYFRQLQEISDSVAEVTWDHSVTEAMQATVFEQTELEGKINTNRARQRFLDHLAKNKEDGATDEDDECCILCRCSFTRGYITNCAHVFCELCMNAWTGKKEGKTCPVCRVIIQPEHLQRFTVEDQQADVPPPPMLNKNEPAPRARREILYNKIDPKLFEDIQTMESFGSYGSKIQALIRHLLFLQVTEPGAKSIVFSAWADSLHIIEHALQGNNIPCLRIDQSKGKQNAAKRFRSDPNILVLLLHGERENAGLNVTCASRVFLVESVVHHGFEVQAIARIDRMGQTKPTEVYCYYAEETVERNILDLAAKQGLSLYTKDNSAGTLNVTPFALDAEKKTDSPAKKKVQKGDFIYKTDDMLAILFPHMYFYEDYLDTADVATNLDDNGTHDTRSSPAPFANAIAGPSRLV